jgi:hypothetical protein
MADRDKLIRSVLDFLKDDLSKNITDPISHTRGKARFVMTSYPERQVKYPMITIKITNIEAFRAGMQTTAMDITLTIELRVWARNQKEKDSIYNEILERLADIQFTDEIGSTVNDFHDFNILSSVEVDEPGKGGIKSRIMQMQYRFFNT